MTRLQILEAEVREIKAMLSKLVGNPYDQGEVSMEQYRVAVEKHDKVTVQRYLDQFNEPQENRSQARGRAREPIPPVLTKT